LKNYFKANHYQSQLDTTCATWSLSNPPGIPGG